MSGFKIWDGVYNKIYYDVKVSGEVIEKCWPNAGKMNATDGTDRKWIKEDNIKVRESPLQW